MSDVITAVSQYGHCVPVDGSMLQNENKEELSIQLNALRCVQCKTINFAGRKIEGVGTTCDSCLHGALSNMIVTFRLSGVTLDVKGLTDYTIAERDFLNSLGVICLVKGCEDVRHSLGTIDAHIAQDHGDSEPGKHDLDPEEHVGMTVKGAVEHSGLPPDIIDLESHSNFEVGSGDEVI